MTSRARTTATVLAAALACLPSAVRAENPLQVKIYGFLNAEVERVWATGGATPYGARWRVSDGNSRLGFSGSYALREGTKAIWQIEGGLSSFEQGGVNDKGVAAVLVSRNTYVGVQDDRFGRLVVGYHDSVYRSLVGSGSELGGNLGLTTQGLDLWNNTSAQMSGNPDSVFSRGEARLKNSVHYLSPDWIVRAGGSYGLDEAVSNGRSRDRFSVAARFKMSGFQLGAGWDRQNNTGVNTDQLQQGLGLRTDGEPDVSTYFYKVVASYTAPTGTYLGLGWERASYGYTMVIPPSGTTPLTTQKGRMTQDGAMISAAQQIGPATLMISYGKLWKLKKSLFFPEGDYEATQLSLGAKYAFNETFMTYAYYTAIDNKSEQNANLGQAPLYSNGLGTSDASLSPGDRPHAVGAGLIARF